MAELNTPTNHGALRAVEVASVDTGASPGRRPGGGSAPATLQVTAATARPRRSEHQGDDQSIYPTVCALGPRPVWQLGAPDPPSSLTERDQRTVPAAAGDRRSNARSTSGAYTVMRSTATGSEVTTTATSGGGGRPERDHDAVAGSDLQVGRPGSAEPINRPPEATTIPSRGLTTATPAGSLYVDDGTVQTREKPGCGWRRLPSPEAGRSPDPLRRWPDPPGAEHCRAGHDRTGRSDSTSIEWVADTRMRVSADRSTTA